MIKLSTYAKYQRNSVQASEIMSDPLDTQFAALSDPTRRAVIETLAKGPATVSALAAPHPMTLPTFMRHLGVLERSGLVRTVKRGRTRTCYLEGAALVSVQGWLAWQREVWEVAAERKDQSG